MVLLTFKRQKDHYYVKNRLKGARGFSLIQVRDNGGCDYVDISGTSENWMDSGHVFVSITNRNLQMDGI